MLGIRTAVGRLGVDVSLVSLTSDLTLSIVVERAEQARAVYSLRLKVAALSPALRCFSALGPRPPPPGRLLTEIQI
eukprot:COSAG04_NODE_7_length_45988_cov_220.188869_44_plen_76_part_00